MSVKKVTINLEICKNTVIQLSCHNIQSKQHQYCISSGLFWLLSQQGYSLTTPHSRTAKTPKRHITTQEGIERNFTSKLAEDYEKENELPLMKWHWEGALHIPPLFLYCKFISNCSVQNCRSFNEEKEYVLLSLWVILLY